MKFSTSDLFKTMNYASENMIVLSDEEIRHCQGIILKIAEDIIDVCDKENICYHLTGGSALGAVRHSGFIPWDDDLDIDILSSDFDRFINAFQHKYGDRYWIHTYRTPNNGSCGNKIRLKNSIFRGREDLESDECGIYVDILRIENTFDNILLRELHGIACLAFGFILSCRCFYMNRELMMKLADADLSTAKIFKFKISIGRMLSFVSVTKLTELTQHCYGLCKNNHSKYVSVPSGRKHYFGEMRLRKDFVETTDCVFEGHKWKIPKDYDAYLKSMYGDYMKMPDENMREKHVLLELKFPDEEI